MYMYVHFIRISSSAVKTSGRISATHPQCDLNTYFDDLIEWKAHFTSSGACAKDGIYFET